MKKRIRIITIILLVISLFAVGFYNKTTTKIAVETPPDIFSVNHITHI